MRNLIGASLLLLAAAGCGGQASTAAPATASSGAPATQSAAASPASSLTTLSVTLRDFKIEPTTIAASGRISIAVTSQGPTPHNFTIRDADDNVVARSRDLRTGESDVVEAQLTAGEYPYFCAFAGHESLGMRGTLVVTP